MTRENALMTVDHEFFEDFRRIDIGLPDPSSLTPGEEATNPGAPRWAILGRSWTDRSWIGRNGNTTIDQSYTIEVWLPGDSGALRSITLWAAGDIGLAIDDDLVVASTRAGIDDGMEAVDAWLDEHPEQ